jgi:hypothetical protein
VAVNPNDTEESIWAFLCEAQLEGPEAARQNMLKVGQPAATFNKRKCWQQCCCACGSTQSMLQGGPARTTLT